MRYILVTLLALAACSSKPRERTVRVAAASDLSRAFEELGKAFEKKTGITPVFDFSSSGLLAKQIDQGAPYYLFAAASHTYVAEVVKSGHCDAASVRPYARGRVVVWFPSGVEAPKAVADLADPRFQRISIANPEHAPYGLAAKQVMQKLDLWDKVQDRLVIGDSVQAAMKYAQSKSVDAAFVALSLAVVTDGGTFLPIDQANYDPLDQELVVCGSGEEADAARQLVAYIGSPEGREVMTRYGFLLPTEQMKK